jgi:hypothetical protein
MFTQSPLKLSPFRVGEKWGYVIGQFDKDEKWHPRVIQRAEYSYEMLALAAGLKGMRKCRQAIHNYLTRAA